MTDLPIIFEIDENDYIVAVNTQWTLSARENETEAVLPERILRSELWSHIADPTLRELYRMITLRARQGRTLSFRYRCDSPTRRRLFAMTVSLEALGRVRFASTLITEEERPAVPLLDPTIPRDERMIRVCSWCQRIEQHRGVWTTIEASASASAYLEAPTLPAMTHGICPTCSAKVLANIRAS